MRGYQVTRVTQQSKKKRPRSRSPKQPQYLNVKHTESTEMAGKNTWRKGGEAGEHGEGDGQKSRGGGQSKRSKWSTLCDDAKPR